MKVTATLLFASFLMTALISMKVIENRDKQITTLNVRLVNYNRLLEIDRLQDSIIESMPEYIPQGWEIDSNGIYNLNHK